MKQIIELYIESPVPDEFKETVSNFSQAEMDENIKGVKENILDIFLENGIPKEHVKRLSVRMEKSDE